jgi:hypothetical protein
MILFVNKKLVFPEIPFSQKGFFFYEKFTYNDPMAFYKVIKLFQ